MKRRLALEEPLSRSSTTRPPAATPPRPPRMPSGRRSSGSGTQGGTPGGPSAVRREEEDGGSAGPSGIQRPKKRSRASSAERMNFTSRKFNLSIDSDGNREDASDISGFGTQLLPDYDVIEAMTDESLPGLIDTHCHIDFIFRNIRRLREYQTFESFRDDYASTFPKCFLGLVSVFCDPDRWLKFGVEEMLEASSSCVRVTYGCHPHFADKFDHGKLIMLKGLLKRPNVVALGEIGLDYSEKNTCPREIQIRVFKLQLKLALRRQLPVCLHIREAIEDGFKVLKEVGVPSGYPLHIHCFNGEWGECQRWLTEYTGCMIGITMLVARERATHIHEVVKNIPLERLILETDAPYFLPPQVKADPSYQLNNVSLPGHVIHAAAQIAELRQIPLAAVLEKTTKNAQNLYKLDFKV